MENILCLGVPILKHIRVVISFQMSVYIGIQINYELLLGWFLGVVDK